jgi:hypothetical protein
MKIEILMEQLETFLNEQTFLMLSFVEEEEYELAAEVRDDIEVKIDNVAKVIKKYEMTKLSEDELLEQLKHRREIYLRTWEQILRDNPTFNI